MFLNMPHSTVELGVKERKSKKKGRKGVEGKDSEEQTHVNKAEGETVGGLVHPSVSVP